MHRYVNSEIRQNSKLKNNNKKYIRYGCVKIKRLPTYTITSRAGATGTYY